MKFLLGTSRGGRNFQIFPDDTFLVSYPKSGNTWTRFLVANLLHPDEPVTFANIERIVPDNVKNTRKELARIPRPRIVKSHEYFDCRYKKLIYIVRDPRDIVVSYYHYHLKTRVIEDGFPLGEYVGRFLRGEVDAYASWNENVLSWLATRGESPDFLLLRYEDMMANPLAELRKIAAFLGLQRSETQLASAVERSSADRMRELEKKEADVWINTKKTRKDIPFVRTAKSGGWKESLPADLAQEIESAWGPTMQKLGYAISSTAPKHAPAENRGEVGASLRGSKF
jgi:Sulfotransferase domain